MDDETGAAGVVEALAGAWTVYNLYPDPETQPSFHRIGESLRATAAIRNVWLDVGPGFFLCDDQEVQVTREAAERLAQRCYVHNIASLGLTDPPSDRDLALFLRVLALEEQVVEQGGGVPALLMREGVSGLSVVTRIPLSVGAEGPTFERDDVVRDAMAGAMDPVEFAAVLIEQVEGDPALLAALFHTRFRETYRLIDESDVAALEQVVLAFVEAFFSMGEQFMVAVLEPFLGAFDDPVDRLFLDQFAGHELARIAPRLDSAGFALLLDYARIQTDEADRRPVELLGLLDTGDGTPDAVQIVTARVQERLRGAAARSLSDLSAIGELRPQFPDPRRHFYHTLDTFRGLLAVEDRDDRFRRLMRLLTGKIIANVRRQHFRHAELWVRSVTDAPTYSPERRREVQEALELACTRDMIDLLVNEVADTGSEAARRLVEKLGAMKMGIVLGLLAEEEDRSRRKVLIDILGMAAERDLGPVLVALDDDRWYVVRNLATVLRASGNPAAVPELVKLLAHGDHRVRVEALRALNTIDAAAIEHVGGALGDDHEVVRRAAVGLLAARSGAKAEGYLIEALNGRLTAAEKAEVIRHLGECESPRCEDALRAVAGRRFVLTGRGRALRAAAREALGARA
ncbi:MAG TPA: hypothetical protein ENH00_05975 [Actinobacteria bacterium]|nr:hypothetical protein BMS3Bbin01_00373 [bacterium BMS3Bbin01]HDH25726.1 hypothetical protein [Actinomycetota bacterium]